MKKCLCLIGLTILIGSSITGCGKTNYVSIEDKSTEATNTNIAEGEIEISSDGKIFMFKAANEKEMLNFISQIKSNNEYEILSITPQTYWQYAKVIYMKKEE